MTKIRYCLTKIRLWMTKIELYMWLYKIVNDFLTICMSAGTLLSPTIHFQCQNLLYSRKFILPVGVSKHIKYLAN